jgi:hypothetical protein
MQEISKRDWGGRVVFLSWFALAAIFAVLDPGKVSAQAPAPPPPEPPVVSQPSFPRAVPPPPTEPGSPGAPLAPSAPAPPVEPGAAPAFGSAPLPPTASPDQRVQQVLEARNIKYTVLPSGDFKLVFNLPNGRTQAAMIRSRTVRGLNKELLREVGSAAYNSGGSSFPSDVANRLLEDSSKTVVGRWKKVGNIAVLAMNVPADVGAHVGPPVPRFAVPCRWPRSGRAGGRSAGSCGTKADCTAPVRQEEVQTEGPPGDREKR